MPSCIEITINLNKTIFVGALLQTNIGMAIERFNSYSSSSFSSQGRQSWGLGGREPPDFGRGVVEGPLGVEDGS